MSNPLFDQIKAEKIASYIKENWHKTIHDDRTNPPPDNINPLPVPHTTPCITGHFTIFFYWDTYFTNIGLILQDRLDVAKNNCEAMAWLIERMGFIPNNTFKSDSNRSQPPYFSLMVREVYEKSGDKEWLRKMASYVKREYQFWMTARHTNLGLNRHGQHASKEFLLKFYDGLLHRRLNKPLDIGDAEKLKISANYLSEAETGWDFNPRFEQRCPEFCPVDLNSNLWRYEKDLAFYSRELGLEEEEFYEEKAAKRLELMRKYLWNPGRGLFMDYDFVNLKHSPLASLASFHPLCLGLATKEETEATCKNLSLFEGEWGLAVCEKTEDPTFYQWGYPNGWPPLTYTSAMALKKAGKLEDARRVAAKYINWAVMHFEKSGQLWEKFDSRTGEIAGGEYEAQPMLGWSAGVFLALLKI